MVDYIDLLENKLKTYYFYCDIKEDKKYNKWLLDCKRYFNALEMLQKGYGIREISRKLKIARETIRKWKDKNTAPYLIRIINNLSLLNNQKYKWLPLRIYRQGKIKKNEIIKVPLKIENYNDILLTIKKVSKKVNITLEDAIEATAYMLGMLVSDAGKNRETLSTCVSLSLSRNDIYNLKIGGAVQNYLSKLGIKSKKVKDNKSTHHNEFVWYSEYSPLITWLMRSALGLEKHKLTTYNSINADWLLKSPKKFRIAFLQGICDGDGSIDNGWRLSIASEPNNVLLIKLLETFGVESKENRDEIIIIKNDSIIRASNIPIFRYAIRRLERAKKLVEMIKHTNPTGIHIENIKIVKKIFELRAKKYSIGEISEMIFDEFKIGIKPSNIYSILKRGKKTYKINYDLVNTYFSILRNDNKPFRNDISYSTLYGWTQKNKVPLDVKRSLSLIKK